MCDAISTSGSETTGFNAEIVRASAVDGCQHGFRTIVIEECVGDRAPAPHVANLFDINAKYGDVISKADAITYIKSLKK